MSSPVNEDRDQRENMSMEDSSAITIKFLRARLLSERSVTKAAMQRAEELSKKVLELEKQLKFTSIRRKKAEKAMADVLAILKNHGISDMSEGFDSNSDQDGILHEFKIDPLMLRGTSTKSTAGKNEMEAYYGSEITSPSTGRSLSWKSTKESQYSLEEKKHMDSIRRRASFALNGSSARRTVKSCGRIRRRDTRAIEKFQNDGPVKATFMKEVSNFSDGESDASRDSNNHDSGKKPADNPMLESDSGSQKLNDRYISVHGREKDMEIALQHQAQLIGRYEEEENTQREWEEKFSEKNSCKQDSGDPDNCSEVIEERDEIKLPEISYGAGTLSSNNQEIKGKLLRTLFSEEPQAPMSLPSLSDAQKGFLQDSSKSPESEISIPVSNGNNDQEISRSHHNNSVVTCQECMPMSSNMAYPSSKISSHAEKSKLAYPSSKISSHAEKSTPLFISGSSSSSLDLTVVPQETSSNLGSVLEALQQAKSSLEKLNSSSLVDRGTSNVRDIFKIPTGSHALLRLPTEDEYKVNIIATQHDIGEHSSFFSFPHEVSGGKLFSRPYVNPKMALPNDILLTVPSSTFTDTRFGVPPQRSLSQPRLGTVPPAYNQTNHIDSYKNMVLPSVKDPYPFLPDFTLRSPLK